jgi:hypothetical protein
MLNANRFLGEWLWEFWSELWAGLVVAASLAWSGFIYVLNGRPHILAQFLAIAKILKIGLALNGVDT